MEEVVLKYNVGDKYTVKGGSTAEIISLKGMRCKVKIRWLDDFQHEQYVNPKRLADGAVSNPFDKSVRGFGYIGVGKYRQSTHKRIYDLWSGMIYRCYCEEYHEKRPSYKCCTVHRDWACFQTFAEWCEGATGYDLPNYQLDKDILVLGNKQYGPDTCAFVPNYVNSFSGIRSYKSKGNLPVGVYKAGIKNSNSPIRYCASITEAASNRKKYLGTYLSEMAAHGAWQKEKANQLYTILEAYAKEPYFNTNIAESLVDRAWKILIAHTKGIETTEL